MNNRCLLDYYVLIDVIKTSAVDADCAVDSGTVTGKCIVLSGMIEDFWLFCILLFNLVLMIFFNGDRDQRTRSTIINPCYPSLAYSGSVNYSAAFYPGSRPGGLTWMEGKDSIQCKNVCNCWDLGGFL